MKNIIKIVTCGDVDSGKSTLLGRLLYNTNNIFNDQLEDLYQSSKKYSIDHNYLEYGMIFDGLKAEREQNITIDTAHRYFKIDQYNIHLYDCPGHIEYTHNFATACYECDIAILVIDGTKRISDQTIRHLNICKEFGINNFIIAITKCDCLDININIDGVKRFLSTQLNNCFYDVLALSAMNNEGMDEFYQLIITHCSKVIKNNQMCLCCCGDIDIVNNIRFYKFLNYNDNKFTKGYLLANDKIESINIQYSNDIYNSFRFCDNEYDCPKNSIIIDSIEDIIYNNCFSGTLIKFPEFNSSSLCAEHITRKNLNVLHISDNDIKIDSNIYSSPSYKYLNCLLLIDCNKKITVGIFIIHSQKESSTIVDSKTIWLTGLSGSGKTTLAKKIKEFYPNCINIDGDEIRHKLSSDLTLSDKDRLENIRRIACIANWLNDKGFNIIVSCISKNKKERLLARDIIGKNKYIEIYCHCSEEERIKRDPKGLYKLHGSKMLNNYELTSDYDYKIINTDDDISKCVEEIRRYI